MPAAALPAAGPKAGPQPGAQEIAARVNAGLAQQQGLAHLAQPQAVPAPQGVSVAAVQAGIVQQQAAFGQAQALLRPLAPAPQPAPERDAELEKAIAELDALYLTSSDPPRPVEAMQPEDVACMLRGLGLGQYAGAVGMSRVGGADLMSASDDDLCELGIVLGLHRRKLRGHLDAFRANGGVPSALLQRQDLAANRPTAGAPTTIEHLPQLAPAGSQPGRPGGAFTPGLPHNPNNACCLCLDAPKTHIVLPCGHKCLCAACASGFDEGGGRFCPLCRCPMDRVQRVFE